MKYSVTMIGIIIAVVGPILMQVGFSEACSGEITDKIPLVVGGIIAWIGRIRAGGVNLAGFKKS